MKPIILNLLSVIRRFKLAAVLNILGLSVAFAAFIVIMIQVDYDYSFDKFHKDYDKIFRVERRRDSPPWQNAIHSGGIISRFLELSPNVIAGAVVSPRTSDIFFNIEKNGEKSFYEGRAMQISPSFTDVFTVDFLEGSEDALKVPNNIIIPLSLSRKLFGKESAIGQQIFVSGASYTVGAVFRDFPKNSTFENCIYIALPEAVFDNFGSANLSLYILVNDPANVPTLFENFERNFDISTIIGPHWAEDFYLDFRALTDVHYAKGVDFDYTPKSSSKQALFILFSIAIVIIAIAAINFTNFSTALAPMRVKSINTQLVLGARRSTLRSAIASEAVFFSFLSFLIAVFFVFIFNKSSMARLVDGDLSFTANPLIFGGTALVALLAGLLAGLYPARYMTSFSPALVLKGSFGLSPKGRRLRNTLIGIQFIASLALIIGASFMYLQNWFMQNSPLGYDKNNLITVDVRTIRLNRDALANQIKSYSGIEDVTFGANLLGSSDMYSQTSMQYGDQTIWIQPFYVYHDFLKVMDVEITGGRDFRVEDLNSERMLWIVNDTTRRRYDLDPGTVISNHEIIGFMPDIKFSSFRTDVKLMGFAMYPQRQVMVREQGQTEPQSVDIYSMVLTNAYIKVKPNANLRDAVSHINATLKEHDPNYIFNIRFFDETLQQLYEKEIALNSLITMFSLLAIFISVVGVFGLVVFDSESRRREIGIRKVFGASVLNIVIMFNKGYLKILVICFVIAAPLAWYAVHRWLQNFAFRTPMYWWVYLLAFVIVGIITVATVTFQNWRVANSNPVDTIKSE